MMLQEIKVRGSNFPIVFDKFLGKTIVVYFEKFIRCQFSGYRKQDEKHLFKAPLVETACTFYMLQACMQGNFLKNPENSDYAQGKIFEKYPCILENTASKSPCKLRKIYKRSSRKFNKKEQAIKFLALLTECYF